MKLFGRKAAAFDDLITRLKAELVDFLTDERAKTRRAEEESARCRAIARAQEANIVDVLGRALHYHDDPEYGLVTGDHVAETLAAEAAKKIAGLERILVLSMQEGTVEHQISTRMLAEYDPREWRIIERPDDRTAGGIIISLEPAPDREVHASTCGLGPHHEGDCAP